MKALLIIALVSVLISLISEGSKRAFMKLRNKKEKENEDDVRNDD